MRELYNHYTILKRRRTKRRKLTIVDETKETSNPSLPILSLTILSRASCRLSWFRPGWLVWTLQKRCTDQTQAQMPVNLQTEAGEESPKHSRSQSPSSLPSWGTRTDRLDKQRRMGLVVTHFTPVKNHQGKSTSLKTNKQKTYSSLTPIVGHVVTLFGVSCHNRTSY